MNQRGISSNSNNQKNKEKNSSVINKEKDTKYKKGGNNGGNIHGSGIKKTENMNFVPKGNISAVLDREVPFKTQMNSLGPTVVNNVHFVPIESGLVPLEKEGKFTTLLNSLGDPALMNAERNRLSKNRGQEPKSNFANTDNVGL